MDYILGGEFDSLTKRVLYAYPAAYPQFKEAKCAASVEAQKDMHAFIETVLQKILEEPEEFGFPIFPDEYFARGQMANTNPELMGKMEKVETRFTVILDALIQIGKMGKLTENGLFVAKTSKAVTKGIAKWLIAFEVTVTDVDDGVELTLPKFPKAFEAWVVYSGEDNASSTKVDRVVTFIYGKYFNRVYRAADFFHHFLKDTQTLVEMEDFYEKNGYECSNSLATGKTRYACTKWSKEYKNGQKSSLSVIFNPRVKNQLRVEFHLPNFRILVDEKYDSFDPELAHFVFIHMCNCSGCGYCTQTDKTGKRPRLARMMESQGEKLMKCPLFPSFTYDEINPEDMSKMQKLIQLAETVTNK